MALPWLESMTGLGSRAFGAAPEAAAASVGSVAPVRMACAMAMVKTADGHLAITYTWRRTHIKFVVLDPKTEKLVVR